MWRWDLIKLGVMDDILRAKSQQVSLFRDELLNSFPKRLTHILPNTKDSFWATQYTSSSGKLSKGQDKFAQLLMEIRATLIPSVPNPPPLKATSPSHNRPSDLADHNRFSVLEDLDDQVAFPPLPPTAGPPRSGATSQADAARQPAAASSTGQADAGGQPAAASYKVCHSGDNKSKWPSPICSADLVILGDSNVSRITKLSPSTNPVKSVEYHSYSGARFTHFQNQTILKTKKPQTSPSKVILSIGINSRDNKRSTNADQIKKTISSATKYFPNSQIYIPLINYSPNLPNDQQQTLDYINQCLQDSVGKFPNYNTIPKLPSSFQTGIDLIHWTQNTANAMVKHWVCHLN